MQNYLLITLCLLLHCVLARPLLSQATCATYNTDEEARRSAIPFCLDFSTSTNPLATDYSVYPNLIRLDISKRSAGDLSLILPNSLRDLHAGGNAFTQIPRFSNPTRLTSLYLQNNAIVSIDADFSRIRELLLLDLRGNRIKFVSPAISTLTSLEQLYLDENSMTEVPTSLCKLSKLATLSISGNAITQLTDCLGDMPSLLVLNIQRNKVKRLPVSLQRSPKLVRLLIRGNDISRPDLYDLKKAIPRIKWE